MYEKKIISGKVDNNLATSLLNELLVKRKANGPRVINKPIILYGAGNLGLMAKNYFENIGIQITLVVDKNYKSAIMNPYWSGVKIISSDQVASKIKLNSLILVCITNSPYVEIASKLIADGWRDVAPFYDVAESLREFHPLSNGWFVHRFDEDEKSSIKKIIYLWEDNI